MRLVQHRDSVLEIRWTWLPYWLAVNPKLKNLVERRLRDRVVLLGVTSSSEDLDAMHRYVVAALCSLFPAFPGLDTYLDALKAIQEPC